MEENIDKSLIPFSNIREFKILGYSIYKLLAYFIIYSIIGYFIEVAFGLLVDGVIASRKSFLYGSFCCIYGLGACTMILALQYFSKNNNKLFLGGVIVGSVVEYAVSLYGSVVLHVMWWDYSNLPLNINGRICLLFSVFWGILAVLFIRYINPLVDKFIDYIKLKISTNYFKKAIITVVFFLCLDVIISTYAVNFFVIRKIHEYDLNVSNREQKEAQYNKIYGNERLSKFIYKYYGDETIIKAFPNLKMEDKNGNVLRFSEYVGDIKPYYYKVNLRR